MRVAISYLENHKALQKYFPDPTVNTKQANLSDAVKPKSQ